MASFSDDQWLYEEVALEGLDRPGQVLGTAELYHCTVRAARLGGATLRRWVFEDCRFEDCDLSNAILTGCTFQRCVFEGCRLVGSDWRGISTMTTAVTFRSCDLTYSVFEGVVLPVLRCPACSNVFQPATNFATFFRIPRHFSNVATFTISRLFLAAAATAHTPKNSLLSLSLPNVAFSINFQ